MLAGAVALVGHGDLDFGRVVLERLADARGRRYPTRDDLAPAVIEDLSQGAVAVTRRLQELRPATLVLVGAAARGRPPGSLERRLPARPGPAVEEAGGASSEALPGSVSIDLLLGAAAAVGALPERVVAIELEPVACEPAEPLSEAALDAVEPALALLRAELRRAPVHALAQRLHGLGAERAPALAGAAELLAELDAIDARGWPGELFALRDALRERIASGQMPPDGGHLEWGLWWGLVEALDRLQELEPSSAPPAAGPPPPPPRSGVPRL